MSACSSTGWRGKPERFRRAFEEKGIAITSTFGGNASYAFAHLLAPLKEQREAALLFLKRACDLSIELGCDVMGTPPGALDYEDARDPQKWEERYQEMVRLLFSLAAYGKEKGLREIHLQQTDGAWDRHRDFTKGGVVTPQLMREATHEAGLDDIPQYLEVVTSYEDDDDAVYDRMKRTMDFLHSVFD